MERIPVFKPLLQAEEIHAAVHALELGWLGMGSFVGQFEAALERMIGSADRRVVAVSTGHAALHLALLLAEVGPGHEVITPSFNNIADFQAILAVGASPVFCDIDESLCLDLASAEALVSPNTRAIIATDYGCRVADHDAIRAFAARHGLRVIHDAAHSLGSTYNGASIGSFSDIAMFSFDPVKTITTIDGGALVVRSDAEVTALREMRLIGMGQPSEVMYQNQRAWTYDVRRLGFRYHMANLHASLGLAQLAKFDDITRTRREACLYYHQRFANLAGVGLPDTSFEGIVPFIYYLQIANGAREAFRKHLDALGIDTGIHWQPGHWFSLFRDCRRGPLEVTERVGAQIVTIPLHSSMSQESLNRVADAVVGFFT